MSKSSPARCVALPLPYCLCRHRRVHHQHVVPGGEQADRLEIAQQVVTRLAAQTGADGVRRGGHEQAVAVGRGARGLRRAEIAAGASAVVDDDLLPQSLGQPGRDESRQNIHAAARRRCHDHAHGFGRISLCPCANRGNTQNCACKRKPQPAVQRIHLLPPRLVVWTARQDLVRAGPGRLLDYVGWIKGTRRIPEPGRPGR